MSAPPCTSAGADVISAFTRNASAAHDGLLRIGLLSCDRVFLAGLNRGALLAAHVAACLGLALLTKLSDLLEFAAAAATSPGVHQNVDLGSLHADQVTDALVCMPVGLCMGNSDTRVGTRNSFELAHLLAEKAAAKGVRSPPHEFTM